MSGEFPTVTIVRHGETAWSATGQHTGRRDIPLTPRGEAMARDVGERLRGRRFAAVFTSPLQRAFRACELAGFGVVAEVLPDLMEWSYGDYEGLLKEAILKTRPDWRIFRDGCPGGESPTEVIARADRAVARLREVQGESLVFAHGHLLRALTARWLGIPLEVTHSFILKAGAVSVLGYEHSREEPAIRPWDDTAHLRGGR